MLEEGLLVGAQSVCAGLAWCAHTRSCPGCGDPVPGLPGAAPHALAGNIALLLGNVPTPQAIRAMDATYLRRWDAAANRCATAASLLRGLPPPVTGALSGGYTG